MKNLLCLLLVVALAGCAGNPGDKYADQQLSAARKTFKTSLVSSGIPRQAAPTAPAEFIQTVKYPAPSGMLSAYLGFPPRDGSKKAGMVWITGGDCNSIGSIWEPSPRTNDQSANQYGNMVMMYPSLRGGNDNPGQKEGFLGEVDDVLAAADFLAKQPGVDPNRIYLGGHSTGGTLALLTAQCSNRFRAVFAFGAVGDVSVYGNDHEMLPFDTSKPEEIEVRSPIYWLHCVQSPTFLIEGDGDGNDDELRRMKSASKNPQIHFLEVKGADHFSVLGASNGVIAKKLEADTGAAFNINLTEDELASAVAAAKQEEK
jgi:alpha/beta superfamily hydrolase